MPTNVGKIESRRSFSVRMRDAWSEDPKHVALMAIAIAFAIFCFSELAYLYSTLPTDVAISRLP